MAKEIFVVEQKLFKAGPCNIDQAQLGLGRRGSSTASFRDVLASGTGGLHHLIHGARP